MKTTKFITLTAAALMSFGVLFVSGNTTNTQEVHASIQLKGKKWASPTITYQINPNVEPAVNNAWTKAIREINKYHVVNFVQSNNPQVTLGQRIAQDSHDLGVTQNWFRNSFYSRSASFLSVNSQIKQRYGSNYAQRQYATAIHELGHVIGLKHDSCKSGVMYYASRLNTTSIDSEYLNAMRSLYGFSNFSVAPLSKTGTVKVAFVPGYGINVWNGLGNNFSNKKIQHGSTWKYFDVKQINNKTWFNLGGNQWVDGAYLVSMN